MPLNFVCPHCDLETQVADHYIGHTGPCFQCDQQITIDTPASGEISDLFVRMLIPVNRTPLSITAGYLGLASIFCFPAPLAIVVGVIAIFDIKKSNGTKRGLGRAWFGIGAGFLFMVTIPLVQWLILVS